MRRMMAVLIVLAAAAPAAAQDIPGWIEKLRSKDADVADNAQEDLLKSGPAAVAPLREAAAKADDAAFRKRAVSVADRLETRKSASGLASAWGDRWYAVYIDSLKVGWVHLKADEKDGKLVFSDELHAERSKTESLTVRATMTCEPDEYLTILQIAVDANGPEYSGSFEGKLKEGRMIVSSNGEKKARKLKVNTVADFALLRLLTVLPNTEEYPIVLFELMKPKLKEDAAIKFQKEESIEHDGKKVKARRFIVSDGEGGEDKFYWVGAAGQLYKIQINDKVEAVLCDEKKAKDIDTKD